MVTFTPSNPPKPTDWTFSEDPISMGGKDEIVFQRDPSASWRFTGAVITPPHPQFTVVDVKDHKMTVRDDFLLDGTWCCVLTVTDGTRPYDSPDPQIVNTTPEAMSSKYYVLIGLVVGAIVGAVFDANTGAVTSRGMLRGLALGALLGALAGLLIGMMLRKGAVRTP